MFVVGRITEVAQKRWKVDVGSHQDGALLLSSIILPGAVQRKRTAEDQLQMRSFFEETHLISAEVQSVNADGSLSLHTRSLKYGKLENGQLVCVPSNLIKRLKQHFVSLTCGVDLILGANGYIWVTRPAAPSTAADQDSAMPLAETLARARRLHAETPMMPEDREKICRVTCAIRALKCVDCPVYPGSIMATYESSLEMGLPTHRMLHREQLRPVTREARRRAGVDVEEEESVREDVSMLEEAK